MNRNYLIGFAAAAALLGALFFAGRTLVEVYPKTKYLPPSHEARINNYLALDRWLEGMGYGIRTEQSGDISLIRAAKEKTIFIQSSLFEWNDESADYLLRWIEEGGNLFLSLDDFWEEYYRENEELSRLLEEFGITVKEEYQSFSRDNECPDYDDDISFEVSESERTLLLKDNADCIRLARVKRGKGKLTVTGRPLFLRSNRIGNAPNARLAWALFAPAAGNGTDADAMAHNGTDGLLFIRGNPRARGLLGDLFRQGNLAVLLVSVLVLLVVCFWSVIPRFGLIHGGGERPGKTLRERFLAEGRFFKRYRALFFYRDVYITEIKRRLFRKEGLSSCEEILKWAAENREKPEEKKDSRLLVKIFRRLPFTCREFPRIVFILKTILERI